MADQQVPKVGSIWRRQAMTYTVRGVVEGYVVYRINGCVPGMAHWKDFVRDFYPVKEDHRG